MKPRTLIIGARDAEDLVCAAMLVKRYVDDGFVDRASGRHRGVIYGTSRHAYVWHTARQITVHLGMT